MIARFLKILGNALEISAAISIALALVWISAIIGAEIGGRTWLGEFRGMVAGILVIPPMAWAGTYFLR